jgi:membrane-associated phospholipid phosphatase
MDRRLACILILLIVSSIALSFAADIVGVFQFDMMVANWLQGENSPGFAAVMGAVSFLGSGWVPVILVFSAFTICAIRKKWIEAVFVIATLTSSILAGALKVLVGRSRPPGFSLDPSYMFGTINQYGYPSGHVLFFVVFFGFIAFLAYRFLSGWMRWITISSCMALILLIGPSRIYLGAHWFSDVMGSYILGTFWLIILILLYLKVVSMKSV